MLRTHDAGSLNSKLVGTNVVLAGWVARRRDHGGVAFIDLRDSSGAVQVVINDEKIAGELRAEWCVLISGVVKIRLIVEILEIFQRRFDLSIDI